MKQSPSLSWADCARNGALSGTKTFFEPTVLVIHAVNFIIRGITNAVIAVFKYR